jgi:hypothetical protein
MNKFEKLSRAEMKNVTGGVIHTCTMVCKEWRNQSINTYTLVVSSVPSCTPDGEVGCFTGTVVSCSCYAE